LRQIRQRSYRALFISRAHRLPFAKFTARDLRRTVATTLAEIGISFELIAAVVGHDLGGKALYSFPNYASVEFAGKTRLYWYIAETKRRPNADNKHLNPNLLVELDSYATHPAISLSH